MSKQLILDNRCEGNKLTYIGVEFHQTETKVVNWDTLSIRKTSLLCEYSKMKILVGSMPSFIKRLPSPLHMLMSLKTFTLTWLTLLNKRLTF